MFEKIILNDVAKLLFGFILSLITTFAVASETIDVSYFFSKNTVNAPELNVIVQSKVTYAQDILIFLPPNMSRGCVSLEGKAKGYFEKGSFHYAMKLPGGKATAFYMPNDIRGEKFELPCYFSLMIKGGKNSSYDQILFEQDILISEKFENDHGVMHGTFNINETVLSFVERDINTENFIATFILKNNTTEQMTYSVVNDVIKGCRGKFVNGKYIEPGMAGEHTKILPGRYALAFTALFVEVNKECRYEADVVDQNGNVQGHISAPLNKNTTLFDDVKFRSWRIDRTIDHKPSNKPLWKH